jgi:sugar phosphate permease
MNNKIYYGWYVAVAAFLSTFISVGLSIYSFSIFLIPMSELLEVSRTTISIALSLFTISMGLVGILAGVQMAKGKVRRLIALGTVLLCGGYLLLSVSQNIFVFYFSYVMIGSGCALAGPVMSGSLMTVWFNKYRGSAVGITTCGASVCAIVIPPMLVIIIEKFGLQIAYLVCAVLVAILLGFAFWIIRPNPQSMGLLPDGLVQTKDNQTGVPILLGLSRSQAVRKPSFWLICSSFILLGFAQMGVLQNAISYLKDLNFDGKTSAKALSFIGISGLFGAVISGWLADRNAKLTFLLGNTVLAIGTLFLNFVQSNLDLISLTAYSIFFGFGMASWLSALPLITANLFGAKYFGAIWGLAFAFKALIGDALGAPIISVVAEYIGYRNAFFIPMIFFVLSIVLVFMAKKPIFNNDLH